MPEKIAPVLELRNITSGYPDGPLLLNGLNLQVSGGERIGIIGPNGSGKTTLLHIIMGLLMPQSGEVLLDGKHMTDESDFFMLRRHIGLVFQDSDDQLFCPTVGEDIACGTP